MDLQSQPISEISETAAKREGQSQEGSTDLLTQKGSVSIHIATNSVKEITIKAEIHNQNLNATLSSFDASNWEEQGLEEGFSQTQQKES